MKKGRKKSRKASRPKSGGGGKGLGWGKTIGICLERVAISH